MVVRESSFWLHWRLAGLGLLLCLAACSRQAPAVVITVGARTSTEQTILGEIAAQQIARRLGVGVEVKRDFTFQSAGLGQQALVLGRVDLQPAGTGTALMQILRLPPEHNAEFALNRVRDQYATQFQLEWMDPLGFDSRFAVFTRADAAEEGAAISGAASHGRAWRMGVTPEFFELREGYGALMKTYRLTLVPPTRTLAPSPLVQALVEKKIDLAAGRATEGALSQPGIRTLEDDKSAFFPNEVSFVVRRDTLARIPKLRKALQELSGRIKLADMRAMNHRVDRERGQPSAVAAEFLKRLR